MSRFGKKLTMVGIWAGIGILIGMQFGGSGGGKVSKILPGWSGQPAAVQNGQVTGKNTPQQPNAGTGAGQTYVYIPVAVDPETGAYNAVPVEPQNNGTAPATGNLPQQVANDYNTLSPEQILIPEEQKPTVDVLADKTAGLLQEASQKSIRWVVSLFDSSEQ